MEERRCQFDISDPMLLDIVRYLIRRRIGFLLDDMELAPAQKYGEHARIAKVKCVR